MPDVFNHPSNSTPEGPHEAPDERAAEARQPDPGPRTWLGTVRWRWVLAGVAGAFLLLILVLAVTAPLSKSLQPITAPSLTLLSAEGVPIARRGAVVEAPVRADELPDRVVQPFLAIEDRRFYDHFGVDPQGLARAALSNAKAGDVVEGGSTITQQLAKLAFLSSDRTVWRKLQEAVLAVWLEARLSKDDILSRYLSSAYFGDNVFGLRAAARHYFSRKPEELTTEEAALLAGLLKAPSSLAPTKHLEAARERAAVVIDAMVDAGMLTRQQAENLPDAKLDVGPVKELPSGTYFADWVMPEAEAELERRASQHSVVTTLEDRLQRQAASAIRSAGTGGAQVALVAMRPDGRVVAMVGGKSYRRSPFNRATQARRQPGSTFKLFVYLAALRDGYRPDSRISDTPLRIGNWTPANYENRYRGDITLREAFAVSSNVAAVRLAEAVGRGDVRKAAVDLGIEGELENGPAMSLGTSGIPLIDMVAAYAAVASGRYPVEPRGLPDGIDEDDGTTFSAEVRRDLLELLWAAANQGTGRAAVVQSQTFGKTGTSQDGRDAYFIGFAGDLVTGVWIGHDDNRPMTGVEGGGLPAVIWRNFMSEALKPAAATPSRAPAPGELPTDRGVGEGEAVVPREYDVDDGPAAGAGSQADAPPDPYPGWYLGPTESPGDPPIIDVPPAPLPRPQPPGGTNATDASRDVEVPPPDDRAAGAAASEPPGDNPE